MKTRVGLKFFLSRRKVSLKRLCEANNITHEEALIGFLDDANVAHPSESDIQDLFPPLKIRSTKPRSSSNRRPAPEKESNSPKSEVQSKAPEPRKRRRRRSKKQDSVQRTSEE